MQSWGYKESTKSKHMLYFLRMSKTYTLLTDIKSDVTQIATPVEDGVYYLSNEEEDDDTDSAEDEEQTADFFIDRKTLQCNICDRSFLTLTELRFHLRKVHQGADLKSKCKYCGNHFSDLNAHIARVHEATKNFECEECGKRFFRLPEVKEHINAVHKKLKPFECNSCDFRAVSTAKLNQHYKFVHANHRPHKCDRE